MTKSVVGCVAGILVDRGLLDPEPRRRRPRPGAGGERVRRRDASGTCSTCAAGCGSARSTPNPNAEVRGSTGGSRLAPRAASDGHGAALPVPPGARAGGRARQPVPLPLRARPTCSAGSASGPAGTRMADLISAADLGADGRRAGRGDHLRRARHGGARRRARGHGAGPRAVRADAAGRGSGAGRGRWRRAPSYPPRGCGGPGRSTPRAATPSSTRRPEPSFPAGGTATSSGSVPGEHGDVLLCLGIHGQMLHVSRRTGTVCVKLSSWPDAVEPGVPAGHAARVRRGRAARCCTGCPRRQDPQPGLPGASRVVQCGRRSEQSTRTRSPLA